MIYINSNSIKGDFQMNPSDIKLYLEIAIKTVELISKVKNLF